MRRWLSGVSLVLLLVVLATGQSNEWKRYKNTEGNFSVLFPGEPNDSVNQTRDATIQSHTLAAPQGTAIYMVVYAAMAKEQLVEDADFEIFKNAVFHELPKCEVGLEKAATPALRGYIGHSYRLSCDMPGKKTVTGNLYWGKHYSYAVMAVFTADADEPTKSIRNFIDSFGLLDAAK